MTPVSAAVELAKTPIDQPVAAVSGRITVHGRPASDADVATERRCEVSRRSGFGNHAPTSA